jgi:hypothetical protein
MLKIAAIVLVGLPVAILSSLLALVLATGLLVVDVKEGGPGGHRIVVPVPLLAAQAALAFVPEDKLRLNMPEEAARHLPVAREVLEALAAAPDGELVRVEQPGERVLVEKRGDLLHVSVHDGDGEDVEVNIPIRAALDVLPRAGERLEPARAVAALRSLSRTALVDVRDGDDHVSVRVY